MRRHLVTTAAFAALLAGCGTSTSPTTPATTATPASPTAAPTSTGGSPTTTATGLFPVVVSRTGGIAGFADRLTVQSDGRAQPATRSGPGAPCRLTTDALQRLEQAVTALAASPAPATSSGRVSDELVTTVQTPAARGPLRLSDAPAGAITVVGELLAEVGGDPAARTLCRTS